MKVKNLKSNQKGMVAIAVTIILLSIVSLIILGFATISRREQRQALDKQLSSEAYYAAEAGVNYLAGELKAGHVTGGDRTNCTDGIALFATAGSVLKDNVEYTCALLYQSVDSLEYTLPKDVSKVIPINATGTISTIEISWQGGDGKLPDFADSASVADHKLPQSSFNATTPSSFANNSPILRTTITPLTANMTRATAIDNSQTMFIYPADTPAAPATSFGTMIAGKGPDNQGVFLDGNCNTTVTTTYWCRAKVTNVTTLANTTKLLLRLKPIYQDAKVRIRVYSSAGTTPLPITGSQAVIDVTARAEDVVKRIQARIPLGEEYYFPEFGLQSAGSICKRLATYPANPPYPAGFIVDIPPERASPDALLDINRTVEESNCDPTIH